ncbi:acetolactate synthase large subunit [Pseudohongiella sp. SYSU M77423]|uniref:acetolactate synthase large subunit n=1 Tax=unclassified Pseudohongiella TaxID=2629611 RepID=UPI001F022816|nr:MULTISPECIES: acetolactate synthase large subunit [unclassified Pseudohongiella]MDH7942393.1 acetolactate synthase large subunit [Pseudohongiella sp. SYSU M77423]
MNGARALIETLAECGVELCLANPGTSEMHLVQALDQVPRMRSVLALFEGVCTGAADGYGRMTGKPAATLLHLGPGLANGIANLHNARKAGTPIINLVGNHPQFHIGYDAPLTSDIDTLARNFSCWIKSCSTADTLAKDGAEAYTASLRATPGSQGQISTLILGADAAWGDSPGPSIPNGLPSRSRIDNSQAARIAEVLRSGESCVMILEHDAARPESLEQAGKIAAKTGCRIMTGTFPARVDGGAGRIDVERMPYFPEHILASFAEVKHLILVGGQTPASFFAYRTTPSRLVPEGCQVHTLARIEEDALDALNQLAELTGAEKSEARRLQRVDMGLPSGEMSMRNMLQAVAATLPEDAIVATDSGPGNAAHPVCQGAAPHSWLSLTGGSIGQGSPVATGAALACPDRRVVALLGDGGAAYTIQSLWTQAREQLNVTTVIFANRKYNILNIEYGRLGVTEVGPIAESLFDIGNPEIDWTKLSESFGVPAAKATTADEFVKLLQKANATPGPFLIQAVY